MPGSFGKASPYHKSPKNWAARTTADGDVMLIGPCAPMRNAAGLLQSVAELGAFPDWPSRLLSVSIRRSVSRSEVALCVASNRRLAVPGTAATRTSWPPPAS